MIHESIQETCLRQFMKFYYSFIGLHFNNNLCQFVFLICVHLWIIVDN